MIPLYPALDLPALDVARLRRGLAVQTRIFFADSIPGVNGHQK